MNMGYAYAEVLEILGNMNPVYVNKIPEKLMQQMRDGASPDYVSHIDENIDLAEQNISEGALNILAIINLKYWVETEEERRELIKLYSQNDMDELKNS